MNKVMLIGNVGREPEMTYTPSGSAVTKFSLAVSRRRKNKETGENDSETTWFNIVAWERLAETCSSYVHKGSKIYVEGRLVMREYTDKEGAKRTAVDIVISEMELLDPRNARPADGSSAGTAANAGEVGGDDFPF
jgi:single-strand DNA-binding protein